MTLANTSPIGDLQLISKLRSKRYNAVGLARYLGFISSLYIILALKNNSVIKKITWFINVAHLYPMKFYTLVCTEKVLC